MSDLTNRLRDQTITGVDLDQLCEQAADVLDAIDALHKPNWHDNSGRKPSWCHECESPWPCDTHLLIHPMTVDEAIWILGDVHK